ncbi:MAG: hypothetical protein LIO53_06985 [Oscillospiraceae bacterium]|nr:hypothetical protein [Oscillospiraceae bacterium]
MAQGIVNAPGNVLSKAKEYTDDALQANIDALEESGVKNPNALTLTLNGSGTDYDGSEAASKTWYAPTSVAGGAGYELVAGGTATTSVPVWKAPSYGVCSTEAAEAAKTVSCTNFKLVTGVHMTVKFTYSHTSSTAATLNVGGTGAKTIYNGMTGYVVTSGYGSWSAGEIVEFVYDGDNTRWVAVSSSMDWLHADTDILDNFSSNGFAGINEVTEAIGERTRAATYVVAASDSGNKYGADYVCTGTSDNTVIQTAIDALPSTGGKIILLEGTYNITDGLSCDKDIVFEGMGNGTVVNVGSAGFMSFTGDSNAVFRDMYFSADNITGSMFDALTSSVDLMFDNLTFNITNAETHGAIVYGYEKSYTRVHLHKVKVSEVYLDNSSYCASVFYRCLIKGGEGCYINLTCTSTSCGAEIFYCSNGCFSNGTLKSEMYINGSSENMSITDSYIYCDSVTGGTANIGLGRLSNNKIIIENSTCYCNFSTITGNEIKKTGSYQLFLYAPTVSGNAIENYKSSDITFMQYSSVTGNVSKYTMSSTTPTGTTIENNVVYSDLSISSTEV